jgi:hypothetical protein
VRVLTRVDLYEEIDAVELIGARGPDGVGDACDNCPAIYNPDQERVPFDQTLLATSATVLGWGAASDVEFVRGDLDAASAYVVSGGGTLAGATGLDLSADDPAAGSGLFYLVRFGGTCGSWQTTPGAEPARDAALP